MSMISFWLFVLIMYQFVFLIIACLSIIAFATCCHRKATQVCYLTPWPLNSMGWLMQSCILHSESQSLSGESHLRMSSNVGPKRKTWDLPHPKVSEVCRTSKPSFRSSSSLFKMVQLLFDKITEVFNDEAGGIYKLKLTDGDLDSNHGACWSLICWFVLYFSMWSATTCDWLFFC